LRLEDLDGAPTVGDGEPVQPGGPLVVPHGGVAHAERDEGADRGIVQERVELIGGQRLRQELRDLGERIPQVGSLDGEELLERR
jgi:hypothetical protein